jgi:hypothetical protein
MKTGVI